MKQSEVIVKSDDQLREAILEFKKAAFTNRLTKNTQSTPAKDSTKSGLKKAVARVKTELRKRELQKAGSK